MAKLKLDVSAMQDDFFADAAIIGIVSASPGYHLCWLLNRQFDIEFARDPEQTISSRKKDTQFDFPIYQYIFPNSSYKYLLYKLKNGTETLLPETKQLDYLWLIQTANPDEDAMQIVAELRDIPGIQLAQVLPQEQLKSLGNLLV